MWFIVLCSILPWLTGGVALSLAFAHALPKPGYLALCLGVGGLLGIIGTSLLTIIATRLGVSLLAPWPLIVLGLIFVASTLRLAHLSLRRGAGYANPPQRGVIALAAFAYVFAIAGINAWQAVWVPATGWDTLWSWAEISQAFIHTTQTNPIPRWEHEQTHPSTVAIISAWSAAHIPSAGGVGPAYLSWWLAWISILLIVFGFTKTITNNTNASALITVASASIPLLTNHALLGGYAEMFLSAGIAGATALLALSLKEHNGGFALLGIILALSCITLKNTGFIFGGCVVLGYLACLAINNGFSKWLIGLMAVLALSAALFVITAGEQSLSFEIGSRQLTLQLANTALISRNELVSLFYNGSFSIAALLLLAPLISFGISGGRQRNMKWANLLMPWLTSLILLGMLCASQLTDYGFLYAIPGNDTGNSRLSLPLITCTLLIFAPLWSLVSNQDRRASLQKTKTIEE